MRLMNFDTLVAPNMIHTKSTHSHRLSHNDPLTWNFIEASHSNIWLWITAGWVEAWARAAGQWLLRALAAHLADPGKCAWYITKVVWAIHDAVVLIAHLAAGHGSISKIWYSPAAVITDPSPKMIVEDLKTPGYAVVRPSSYANQFANNA